MGNTAPAVTKKIWRTRAMLVIVAIVIALTAVDRFLAAVEAAELRGTAERSFAAGTQLLDEGKLDPAVDQLSTAHALVRGNQEYEVILIRALRRDGRITEAESLMTDALQREPNDGLTNLAAARVLVVKAENEDAEAYYHRAIYGEWPKDAPAHQIEVRRELIGWLLSRGQRQEALAELISLEGEAPDDPAIRKELARELLDAGSPQRAASVYTALIASDPNDLTSYEGLGEADLQQGNYRAARATLQEAFLRSPKNGRILSRLALLNTLTGLDPTPRQISSMEKYRRSMKVLEMTRESLQACTPKDAAAADLIAGAQKTSPGKVPAHPTNEDAEEVLGLAENLWRVRLKACGPASQDEEALGLIMEKLTP